MSLTCLHIYIEKKIVLHVYRHARTHAFAHFGSSDRASIPNDRNSVRANVNDETVTSSSLSYCRCWKKKKTHFFSSRKGTRAEHFAYIVSSLDLLVSRKTKIHLLLLSSHWTSLSSSLVCTVIILFLFLCCYCSLYANERTNKQTKEKLCELFSVWTIEIHTNTYIEWKSNRRTIFQSSLKSIDRSWCRLFALLNLWVVNF